jgi:hypothetical protein
MKDVGKFILLPFRIFYGHLVYFVVSLVYFVVILVYFSRFGILRQEISGNPDAELPSRGGYSFVRCCDTRKVSRVQYYKSRTFFIHFIF